MKTQNRRTFIASLTMIGAAISGFTFPTKSRMKKKVLSHHVFFWLKNPDSKEDLAKLIQGLNSLRKIETIKGLQIGVPASTEKRDVVDNTFSVSELMFFDDVEGQKVYQDHPLHTKFVEECSGLWEKVIVYDAIEVDA
jgi:hypothetical protein